MSNSLDKLENEIKYLKNTLNNIDDKKIMLSIIERMENQRKEEERKYRLCFWNEYKYIQAKGEIYDKIMEMEKTQKHKTEEDLYNTLINQYKELWDEQKEYLEREKKYKREARKNTNRLWKEQADNPIKSFIISVG